MSGEVVSLKLNMLIIKCTDVIILKIFIVSLQPSEMIEKIQTFKSQQADVVDKIQQLSHLTLDASSLEAVKQLKGKCFFLDNFAHDVEQFQD